MNETGAFAGPLNPDVWTPVLAPNMSAIGAGGGAVFVSDELDTGLTSHTPLNLTMMNATLPASVDPVRLVRFVVQVWLTRVVHRATTTRPDRSSQTIARRRRRPQSLRPRTGTVAVAVAMARMALCDSPVVAPAPAPLARSRSP